MSLIASGNNRLIEDVMPAMAILVDTARRDARVLAAMWHGDLDARSQLGSLAAAADAVGDGLAAACRTQKGAREIASCLPEGSGGVAMCWATSQASRVDLALAPLLGDERVDTSHRVEAAIARLMRGPLHDAIECLPTVFDAGRFDERVRLRVDTLFWELSARGLVMVPLGAWACTRPELVQSCVVDRAGGSFASRVRAARMLGVLADGLRPIARLPLGAAVTRTAVAWLEHPDPLLWTPAACALGRLAAHATHARDVCRTWSESNDLWRRRRIATALGAIPLVDSETWIDVAVGRMLDPATQRADVWQAAALAAAAPHLARDRAGDWGRLLESVETAPLEIVWSLAQGIAALARRGNGRGLTTSERDAVETLRLRIALAPRRATDETARVYQAEVHLAWALGEPPPPTLAFESADDAVRAAFAGNASASPVVSPNGAFASALAHVDAPDEETRGRAHLAMRSATRALASRIGDLVSATAHPTSPTTTQDTAPILDAIEIRLTSEVCEFGLRSTLVGCLGDLVDLARPGVDPEHGRIAASALRIVASSRWVVQEVLGDTTLPTRRAHVVKRFRKPLEDLFDRCVASRPEIAAHGATTVPPQLAAWWALFGSGTIATELDREPGEQATRTSAALATIQRALADARLGLSAARWGADLADSFDALAAGDTMLASTVAQLATALEAASQLDEEGMTDSPACLNELLAAVAALVDVGRNLDLALLANGGGPRVVVPIGTASTSNGSIGQLRYHESDIPSALRPVIAPMIETLVAARGRVGRPALTPGARIGGFELIERLGGGGMGEVWKARRGRQIVALKVPHAGASRDVREMLAEALRAESDRFAPLCVAKVATFIDAGVDNDVPYLAIAYLRGRTWQEHALVPGAPAMEPALVRRLARDVCTGLANLHELGIAHRDLTPRNIFLRFRGQDPSPIPVLADDPHGRRIDEAVLIDLGIAQSIGERASDYLSYGYVAPEILTGDAIGPPADIYALGATLFHVLTGRRFADGLPSHLARAWHLEIDPLDEPSLSELATHMAPDLAPLIAAATRRDPALRPSLEEIDARL